MEKAALFAGAVTAAMLSLAGCTESTDQFQAYREQVNRGGGGEDGRPVQDTDRERREFEAARATTCSMSKEDLMGIKALSGMGTAEDAARAANQLGALWEYACDNGHDEDLYRAPVAPKSSPEPTPVEPDPSGETEIPQAADEPLWPAWPGTVYTFGDCDPALVDWQLQMNTYGYDFQGTGCYYQETAEAVSDLQEANGLDGSGRIGPATWDAAWSGVPPAR